MSSRQEEREREFRERKREGKRVLRKFREMTRGLRPQDCGATENRGKIAS